MPDYRIIWEIDIDADNPREAARKAREIQLDLESTATIFLVKVSDNPDAVPETIDVAD